MHYKRLRLDFLYPNSISLHKLYQHHLLSITIGLIATPTARAKIQFSNYCIQDNVSYFQKDVPAMSLSDKNSGFSGFGQNNVIW